MLLHIDHIAPTRIAVLDSEGNSVTYGEIVEEALRLRETHAEREFRIVLVENTADSVKEVMAMIASERIVPLILNKKTDPTLLQHLKATYGDTGTAVHPQLSHLLPTSGSTGSPKLVRHCYENIEAAGLNIATFFRLKETDRPLMVLPLYYTMGLSMIFSHFKVGATVLITGLNMTDAGFWRFLKDEHATSFTGVPYSYQILNLMRFYRMDLPDLELLTQGGGKMPKDLNLRFAEYCQEKGKRWVATYGQSECTARMAYLPAKWAVEKVGSIGIAVPNGELSLIDEAGHAVTTPHTEGEMCYRGKNVTMGYATCAQDLMKGDERHGYIHTGDLAYFDEDGCYYIVGRMGRFLKLFGMRVGLDECEQIITTECRTEVACVGTDEKMIVYITDDTKKETVKQTLVEKTHIVATSFEIRVVAEIPKNETGKKLYSQLEKQ
ncbi:MAG: AMP-binding protein [Paludibacteraceae bacterium]|nr:AMP-binding protein [Paludibacteraceae bacterium]